MLHRHGALACFDYAAAGPYLPIDMAGKDAVFLSPHKFAGGPGTPGILVAKRSLLRTRVPSVPGGGTIVFVSPTAQTYHPDPAVREEAGTPAIVESIRAGLVFALKEAVGAEEIRRREDAFARRALASWGSNPNIEILGNPEPSGSRSCRSASATRAGCCTRTSSSRCSATCSGSRRAAAASAPARTSIACIRSTTRGRRRCTRRPGWAASGATLAFARVSFNYFISEAVFDYIVEAVHLLANEGWKLLPLYRFDPRTGLWHHADARPEPLLSLHDLSFDAAGLGAAARATAPESALRAPARRGAADHPRGRGRAAVLRAARPGAVAGVRAHPLVPAPGRGACSVARREKGVECTTASLDQ